MAVPRIRRSPIACTLPTTPSVLTALRDTTVGREIRLLMLRPDRVLPQDQLIALRMAGPVVMARRGRAAMEAPAKTERTAGRAVMEVPADQVRWEAATADTAEMARETGTEGQEEPRAVVHRRELGWAAVGAMEAMRPGMEMRARAARVVVGTSAVLAVVVVIHPRADLAMELTGERVGWAPPRVGMVATAATRQLAKAGRAAKVEQVRL